MAGRSWVSRLRDALPRGGLLPDEIWQQRHRTFVLLLWIHAFGLFAFAVVRGFSIVHSVTEAGIVALAALLGGLPRASRMTASIITTFGLLTSSAVLVHLSGGTIEAHFHFFVVMTLVPLYQSWIPFGLAIAYVVSHHGLVGYVDPESVFNHPSAIREPMTWAAIHGAFILASSVAGLIVWKRNEDLRERLRTLQEIEFTERSAREQAQAQLRRSRMETLGQLAGGIAHDFNNLLAGIVSYTTLVRNGVRSLREESAEKRDEIYNGLLSDVAKIEEVSRRAGVLTSQLLLFGRKDAEEGDGEVVDVNAIVKGMEDLLRRTIGEHIQFSVSLGPPRMAAAMKTGHLEQILMNLVVNARDAMPNGGKLIVETKVTDLDEQYASTRSIDPGPYVCLSVSDTGTGMPSDVAAHAFEPFFSTKGPGEGTGLGLATVYGMVTARGGHVAIHSQVGEGTTVSVYLPRLADIVEERSTVTRAPAGRGKGETILLAEDEDSVRDPTRRFLIKHGYKVLAAADPAAALEIAEAHTGPVHLLLTDVIMPGMTGKELAERILEARPDMRVIFMSGYAEDVISSRGAKDAGFTMIQKPFDVDSLLEKIRASLDAVEPSQRVE